MTTVENLPAPPHKRSRYGGLVRNTTAGLLLLTGFFLFILDLEAPLTWSFLMLSTGLFLGMLLSRNPPRPLIAATMLALLIAPAIIVWRMLPIHSMGWSTVDRLVFEYRGEEDRFEVTDPEELIQFTEFAARGSLHTSLKGGLNYRVTVYHGKDVSRLYMHGSFLGPDRSGFTQSIFIPSKPGFMEWFADLCARHGHPRVHNFAPQPVHSENARSGTKP